MKIIRHWLIIVCWLWIDGCKFNLPPDKILKICENPKEIEQTINSTEYSNGLKGSTTDIKGDVTWKLTNLNNNSVESKKLPATQRYTINLVNTTYTTVSYTISCEFVTICGETTILTKAVTLTAKPCTSPTAIKVLSVNNNTYSYGLVTDMPTDIKSVKWSIQNGPVGTTLKESTDNSPFVHTYTGSGNYTVTAEVTTVCSSKSTVSSTEKIPILFSFGKTFQLTSTNDLVHSATLTTDFKRLAVLYHSGIIRFFDTLDGRNYATCLPENNYAVGGNLIEFIDNENSVLSFGCAGNRLINANNGNFIKFYPTYGCINWGTFRASDDSFLVASAQNQLFICSITTGNVVHTLIHTDRIRSFTITTDNKFIATSTDDKNIFIWSINTRLPILKIPLESVTNFIGISPNNKYIIGLSWNGQDPNPLRLYDFENGNLLSQSNGILGGTHTACFDITNNYIVVNSYDKKLNFLSLPALSLLKEMNLNSTPIKVFSEPSGKYLYVITEREFQVLNIQ